MLEDTIKLFESKLKAFCERNNIEMGFGTTLLKDTNYKKYIFLYKGNKLGVMYRNYQGFYVVINYNEVEDICQTYESITQYLVDAFDLCPEPEAVYADALDTVVKKPMMYITTARATGKSEIQRRLEERLSSEPLEFYTSPEWKKCMLNAMFGKYAYTDDTDKEKEMKVKIEKVYFNAPYTIVIWSDKTKTMVKAENECYDEEKGLAMAICKKFLGTNESGSNYFDVFKKWLPKIEGGPVKEESKYRRYVTAKEFAELSKVDISTVRKHCRMGLITGAIKQSGAWLIPIKSFEGKMEV